MKKVLQDPNDVFLYMRNGEVHPGGFSIEEILAGVNRGLEGDWGHSSKPTIILKKLYDWICRYIDEGVTEELCNDLNNNLVPMGFSKYVVTPDFFPPEDGSAHCLYVADFDKDYTYETHAANEFSKLITTGKLDRLKRCQLPECNNIFLGPPQAKWCSKSCGSKYRVRKKRKRDLS